MTHVDALSRIISLVEPIPMEKQLEINQLSDTHLLSIAEQLQNQSNDNYELRDGLIFKKNGEKSYFVVPDSMVNNVIRAHHDDLAHCGAEKTINSIKTNYWFPNLRKKVVNYINNCITCLMASSAVNSREGSMRIFDTPSIPFYSIHIDDFGPFPKT